MRRLRLPIIIVLAVSFLLFLVLHCGDVATNPHSADKAKVTLFLISSDFAESDTAISDTAGKKMRLGVRLYLSQHIDSTVITIGKTITSLDTMIVCNQKEREIDTVYYTLSFSTAGDRTVIATGYVGKNLRPTATATIHIRARPAPNHKPELSISGNRDVIAGQTCALEVTTEDPDSGQSSSIIATNIPSGAAFDGHTFSWITTMADTGVHTAVFIATDNGYPSLSDTTIITIAVTAPGVNRPPKWNEDTIVRTIQAGSLLSLTLADKCSDPDNDSLHFTLLAGTPAGDTILNTTYSFTPTANDTGVFFPRLSAIDPQGAADTVTVKLTVVAVDNDTLPPVITLLNPSKDTIIGLDSCSVRMTCTDASGIASVVCALGSQTFTAAKSPSADGIYTATIKGLSAGDYSTVTIIATDASTARNVATDTIKIKYDNDTLPPIITRFDPAKDTFGVNANSYAVKVVCRDPSGVASIIYSLGTETFPAQKGAGDTVWSANVTGLVSGAFNKITAVAADASLRANKDTLTIIIKYDPTMTDSVGPIIFQKNGPASGAIVTDSIITIIDSIYDPSGIDSMYWTLNNGSRKFLTTVSGKQNWYLITDTLQRFGLDTITVTAVDNATARNRTGQTIILNYALPARITSPLSTTTTVVSGSAIALHITATGTPTPAYQWYKNATAISLATSASYSKIWAASDTGTYKVVVSNIAGKDSSSTQLIVTAAPTITTEPSSLTKCPGDSVTLTVIATGTAPLSYQWKKGSANTGANSPSLTINPVASASAGSYTVIVSNMAGSDTSSEAILIVNTVSSKPAIVPATPATCPGSPITLHLSGGTLGTGASWKWYTGNCGGTLAGSDSTLTVNPSVNTVYYVRAEGGCQTTDCAFAQVTVNTIPTVTAQPASQTLWVGDSVSFSITANGTTPLTYQWYHGATAIGTNSPLLKIKPIAFADSGNYTCVVTNSCGKDTSDVGKLTVKPVFTVSFNSNGGSTVPSQSIKSDSLAKKPANPTLSGYTFAEWYSDSALTILFNFSTPITAAKTLYAKWVVMDIDGNIYTTVTIGTQTWMVENLKTTRFNDGSAIPLVEDSTAWRNLTTPGYCWYDNDSATYKNSNYGALYNWYSVNTGKLAPPGWHVPTDVEWDTLQNYLIANGYNYDGTTSENKIAKALAAKTNWAVASKLGAIGDDLSQNNKSRFTALPGGYRNSKGIFWDISNCGMWWNTSDPLGTYIYPIYLYYYNEYLCRFFGEQAYGNSVRLIRNN